MTKTGERSDDIRLYKIDPETGLISQTDSQVHLPAPASILFVE